MMDSSQYSFQDLRKAYLERLQAIHPDKRRVNKQEDNSDDTSSTRKAHEEFVELQEAWNRYETMARKHQIPLSSSASSSSSSSSSSDSNNNNIMTEANFTMFGVGCSFSDNEAERALRDEITTQACRGWFSAGALAPEAISDHSSGNNNKKKNHLLPSGKMSLLDDDLFVHQGAENSFPSDNDDNNRTFSTVSSTNVGSLPSKHTKTSSAADPLTASPAATRPSLIPNHMSTRRKRRSHKSE